VAHPSTSRKRTPLNFRVAGGSPFAGAFPACFRVARSQPSTIRPCDAPHISLHLNYCNDCVIISRALISSPQGGYMVHAARTSTARAPSPLSTRHFLIPRSGIRNARNSPENNALNFSNRLKTAICSARFSHVSRSRNHHSPVTHHASDSTNHQSLLTNHAFLIASPQNIKKRRK
jgi:hypothetical protein